MKIEAKLLIACNKSLVSIFYKRIITLDIIICESTFTKLEAYQLTFAYLAKILLRERIENVLVLGESEPYFHRIFKTLQVILSEFNVVKSYKLNAEELSLLQVQKAMESNIINPFINGFRIFLTGLYPYAMKYEGIKHCFIKDAKKIDIKSNINLNINSSVILVNDDTKYEGYFLEKILIKEDSRDKFNILLENTKETYSMIVVPFVKKNKLNEQINFKDQLVIFTIQTNKDLDSFKNFILSSSYRGELSPRDCLWLILNEYIFLSDTNSRRVETHRKIIIEDSTGSTFAQILEKENFSLRGDAFKYNGLSENWVSHIITARNILKSFVLAQNTIEKMFKFSTIHKSQWIDDKYCTGKYYEREYFLFQYFNKCYIFHKQKNRFYSAQMVVMKLLEHFYYTTEENKVVSNFSKDETIELKKSLVILKFIKHKFEILL